MDAEGTLVDAAGTADFFCALPGVEFPAHLKRMRRLDFGPDRAVPARIPPEVGDAYPCLVSALDADGNETGGVRLPAIAVPLATYTGWNVRHPSIGGFGQALAPGGTLAGSAIPFARNREERLAAGDPRPSIEERYGSRAEYLERVRECAESLAGAGYLLADDIETVTAQAAAVYDAIMGATAALVAAD